MKWSQMKWNTDGMEFGLTRIQMKRSGTQENNELSFNTLMCKYFSLSTEDFEINKSIRL